LHQPGATGVLVDLYHNPFARVPIPLETAALYVRKQHVFLAKGRDRDPNVLDLMAGADRQRWLGDPDGECDRETERVLAELRGKNS
jgi:hypothetical protein